MEVALVPGDKPGHIFLSRWERVNSCDENRGLYSLGFRVYSCKLVAILPSF